jgi:chaperonin GroES
MRPINDNVIVRLEEARDQSVGGIIVPDKAQGKPDVAIVLFVNDGVFNKDTGLYRGNVVKAGNKVLFNKYAGVEITLPDGKALIIKDSDIFAIID